MKLRHLTETKKRRDFAFRPVKAHKRGKKVTFFEGF
jgi:hypothetical protein